MSESVKSKNGDKFIWSSYWHKWSRILVPMTNKVMWQVEVDLQPNDEKRTINIRRHCTMKSAHDKIVSELPMEVVEGMQKRFGEEITQRLLHEDFLPNIDWDKYEKRCNGGAEFDTIKKG